MAPRPLVSLVSLALLSGCTLIDLSQLGGGPGPSGGESSAGNDPGGGSDEGGTSNQGGSTGVTQGGSGGGTSPPTYADCVVADGPAIYFRANSPAGATSETNLGTLGGAGMFAAPDTHVPFPGLVDGDDEATRFNSKNGPGGISVAGPTALFGGFKPFSLETWIEIPFPVPNLSLFSSSDGTNTLTLRIVPRPVSDGDDALELRFQSATGDERFVRHFLDLEQPVAQVLHVVAVYRQTEGQVFAGDGSSDDMLLYLNGTVTPDATQGDQVAMPDLTSSLSIGNGFDGLMDEIAVYARELEPAEVSSHYATGQDAGACRQ